MSFNVAEELANTDGKKARKLERLEQIRRIEGLQKKELAKKLGINDITYVHLTKGRREPNDDHMKAINRFLESYEYDEVVANFEGENPVVHWITDIKLSLEAWANLQKFTTKELRDLLGETLEDLAKEVEENSEPEANGELVRERDD